MSDRHARSMPEVVVVTSGEIPHGATEYARAKVFDALADHTREPVLHARLRLTQMADPAVARPAIAQANVDMNGRLVRAHVAAETMREAVDAVEDRLRDRLERLRRDWEARRGQLPVAEPHEWRRGAVPTRRPDYYPRPIAERQIVRHKSFTLAEETPDEAAFEMEAMDYDFHLFTDIETGQDSVIYRAGPTGYRLAEVEPAPDGRQPVAVPLTFSPHAAAHLTVHEATERLELTGLPFVFFADAGTGRGNVLYHRYDGHYGLITPAE